LSVKQPFTPRRGAPRSRHPSAPAEHASAKRSVRDPWLFSGS